MESFDLQVRVALVTGAARGSPTRGSRRTRQLDARAGEDQPATA